MKDCRGNFGAKIKRDIEYGSKLYRIVCTFSVYWDIFFREYSLDNWEIDNIIEIDENGNKKEVKLESLPQDLQDKINEIEPEYDEISDAEQDYYEAKADYAYETIRDRR